MSIYVLRAFVLAQISLIETLLLVLWLNFTEWYPVFISLVFTLATATNIIVSFWRYQYKRRYSMQLSIDWFHFRGSSIYFISTFVITQFALTGYFRILACVLRAIGHHIWRLGISWWWISECQLSLISWVLVVVWFVLSILAILISVGRVICNLILIHILWRNIRLILARIRRNIVSYTAYNASGQLHKLRFNLLELVDLSGLIT